MTLHELQVGEVFLWGCVGGFGGSLATATIPWLTRELAKKRLERPGWVRIGFAVALLVAHTAVGGVVAMALGQGVTEGRQAVYLGVFWPVAFKGIGTAGKEIVTAGNPDRDGS